MLSASGLGDNRIFCRVIDEEGDGARGVDEWKCEGDALGWRFWSGRGDDVFGRFKKRSGTWEKGGGVSVFADSKQQEIVAVTFFCKTRCDSIELSFAEDGGLLGGQFALDSEYIPLGDRNLREERFVGHAKVAVSMVRRNAAFITKGNLGFVPLDPITESRELFVDLSGGGTSCETEAKEAAFCNGVVVALENEFDGSSREIGCSQDSCVGRSLHGMNALRTAEVEERRVR